FGPSYSASLGPNTSCLHPSSITRGGSFFGQGRPGRYPSRANDHRSALGLRRPHQLVGEMFRRSSVGVATSRAGHHQHRSHRVLSSRVHFLDKGRSHPLGSCLSAPKVCSLKPLPLEAQFHSDRARSEKSVLSFIASFLIGELLLGNLSETVVVQGNAPHDRPGAPRFLLARCFSPLDWKPRPHPDDVAEVLGLGFGAWVKHSPPKRLRNASAVAASGKQNRI